MTDTNYPTQVMQTKRIVKKIPVPDLYGCIQKLFGAEVTKEDDHTNLTSININGMPLSLTDDTVVILTFEQQEGEELVGRNDPMSASPLAVTYPSKNRQMLPPGGAVTPPGSPLPEPQKKPTSSNVPELPPGIKTVQEMIDGK